MTAWSRWLHAATLALLVALVGLGSAEAAPAPGAGGEQEPPTVVLVGAAGLAWSDVRPEVTPQLQALADEGTLASLTVRGVRSRSCALDGWLTLSAGRRAGGPSAECHPPGEVVDGRVPGWGSYRRAARSAGYDAVPGTLGRRLQDAGRCVAAVGPGAAVAAADTDGHVRRYTSQLPQESDCALLLVDAGRLPPDAAGRTEALRSLDALVGEVVRSAGPDTRVVVAGVGDGPSPVRPRAVLVSGPPTGLLTSPSTRQPGLVQLQDLTASLLAWSGVDDSGLTGRPVQPREDDATGAERVARLVGLETRAGTLRSVSPQVTAWLAAGFALWCLGAAAWWWRRGSALPAPLAGAGVALACVPTATFAANLVPWWDAAHPAVAFTAALAIAVAVLTGLALAARRRSPLGTALVPALATLVVLGGDVLTGSRLQLASVFGQNPTVAGRFYGLGNTSFALYGVGVLTVVALVAAWRRPGRRVAVGLAAAVLLAAVVLEGHPSLGADFGGPPGLLLGGLVVLAGVGGLRVTPVRAAVAAAGVVSVTVTLAVLDWLRPAESRTHLGQFVQTVLDGGAGDVVRRKAAQNLDNLGSPPLLAITLGAVVLLLAWRAGPAPGSLPATVLRAALVLGVVGFAVNDSGLVVPAYAALALLPLLAAGAGEPVSGSLPARRARRGPLRRPWGERS
ncbi:hypothetical protein [Phycicoccus endophyticus]|uniref:hypothetical protein n=1 Tax=Phycicoccus endophyticus TaxID=1690220 RepID=UPI00140A0C27|nr:hypothetical protein [Phycicoccus endophyticus]NHI19314.1 hypothetical protein [Phycicoccus endophyticus]